MIFQSGQLSSSFHSKKSGNSFPPFQKLHSVFCLLSFCDQPFRRPSCVRCDSLLHEHKLSDDRENPDRKAIIRKILEFPVLDNPQHESNRQIADNRCSNHSCRISPDQPVAGMDRMNEYFTANFRSSPQNVAAAIVLPERESPGSVAKPWAIPIRTPSP